MRNRLSPRVPKLLRQEESELLRFFLFQKAARAIILFELAAQYGQVIQFMNVFDRISLFICNRMPAFRDFYFSLPIIRDLHFLRQQIAQLDYAAKMQCIETLKTTNPHFKDPKRLLCHGAQYWSQNFEDGMIEEIFRRILPTNKTFVEIGVENGTENNTTALLAAGWNGWWLEGNAEACTEITQAISQMPSINSRLKLKQAYVSPLNIQQLFEELGIPQEVDLFSLDIDMHTYHICAALPHFKPRVIVVEYNGGISPSVEWITPWKAGETWDRTQKFGASLKAFELLGRARGYSLVGCDLTGINAFFVRNDLLGNHFAEPFTAENHYECPKYYLTMRFGHRSVLYEESHDPKRYPYT